MVGRLDVKGYKALREVSVPFTPFTLFIGPNGCGKSSLLEALQLLQNDAPSDLDVSQRSVGVSSQDWEIVAHLEPPGHPTDRMVKNYSGVASDLPLLPSLRVRSYSFNANKIALPCQIAIGVRLGPEGEGLAACWDQLRDQQPEQFELLTKAVREVLPEYDRLLLKTVGQGTKVFELRTLEGGHAIPAHQLSHGTRLALALLTLNYLPERPDILCLEEPDQGLHPRLLRDVQDVLYRLSYPEDGRRPVQVVATTHNPYFLELFRDHPEEVVIGSKQGLGASFSRLLDLPNAEEILQDTALGECWYSGLLGGVPLPVL